MKTFKDSVNALAFLLIVIAVVTPLTPLVGQGQRENQPAPPLRDRRNFYLTPTLHNGSQALAACAEGYHMASLWEIFDPSNLRYDVSLGLTQADSGLGPPSGESSASGWIRTGSAVESNPDQNSGLLHCSAWTDGSQGVGSTAWFSNRWQTIGPRLVTDAADCVSTLHVWCVED